MNESTKTNRTILFLILFVIAYIGILSLPDDNSKSWFTEFLVSKAIGFSAIYGMYKLHSCKHSSD